MVYLVNDNVGFNFVCAKLLSYVLYRYAIARWEEQIVSTWRDISLIVLKFDFETKW
jgi:hypothetical protein